MNRIFKQAYCNEPRSVLSTWTLSRSCDCFHASHPALWVFLARRFSATDEELRGDPACGQRP